VTRGIEEAGADQQAVETWMRKDPRKHRWYTLVLDATKCTLFRRWLVGCSSQKLALPETEVEAEAAAARLVAELPRAYPPPAVQESR
jgi:hypothetical protein